MPSESRFSQTATLIGASALGIIAMVVVPRHCHQDTASQSDLMVAPAPDAIGSRPSNAAMRAPHVAGVKAKSKADTAQFLAQANELLKRPLEAMSDQLDELMTQWASSDPVAASAWVKQLTPGDIREAAAISLCQTWTGENPAAAAAWAKENLDKGMLQGALGAVSSVWAQTDPTAAAAWIAGLAEPTDRTVGELALAQAWAEQNPAAAAAWAETLSPESRANVVSSLVTGMAASDPAAAAAWLQGATTDDPKLPVENVAIVVSSWVDSDAGAVSRWLNALPAGAFYEAAATAFSQAAAEKSPADAILWARSLAKPENREQAVIYAMELWIEKDRHGFVDALPAQLEATTDPALRKAIYDMLYRKDPGFKESLLNLAEEPAGR